MEDNAGLFHALSKHEKVLPIFIFDTNILEKLQDSADARVSFIYTQLTAMNSKLNGLNSSLRIEIGQPLRVFEKLSNEFQIATVVCNNDYEPYATQRDNEIDNYLKQKNIQFAKVKDHVIFEPWQIYTPSNGIYKVFTPYSKKWKELFTSQHCNSFDSVSLLNNLVKAMWVMPSLQELGFKQTDTTFSPAQLKSIALVNYEKNRDFPFIDGTTKLSVHLRFGTISIRKLVNYAIEKSEKFLNELIWREFYQYILFHFPTNVNACFKSEYNNLQWENNEDFFERWCAGKTGYPIVDAGMRQLNNTGWMHNRVRMVCASFLCKHLLISWQWGEQYFADKLIDFELASNNGGWQWAAGCGVDAAPYFRIFNPMIQQQKFDPNFIYCKKWIPELNTKLYPQPIVNHEEARKKCLAFYKKHLNQTMILN